MIRTIVPTALLLAACAPAPARPAPAPVPVPVTPPVEAPPAQVWTREAGLALVGERTATVPFLATRLDVVEVRPDSLRVRCPVCAGAPLGWVAREAVVWRGEVPAAARQGELAEFVVALRAAALRRDWEALRAVMSRGFVHAISGPDGTLEAVGAWRGGREADVARLPALLDRGSVLVPGTDVWAAPPEFAAMRGYADLRAGFMRGPAGWEWIFLVRDEL